jgi:hypothetical protein
MLTAAANANPRRPKLYLPFADLWNWNVFQSQVMLAVEAQGLHCLVTR